MGVTCNDIIGFFVEKSPMNPFARFQINSTEVLKLLDNNF